MCHGINTHGCLERHAEHTAGYIIEPHINRYGKLYIICIGKANLYPARRIADIVKQFNAHLHVKDQKGDVNRVNDPGKCLLGEFLVHILLHSGSCNRGYRVAAGYNRGDGTGREALQYGIYVCIADNPDGCLYRNIGFHIEKPGRLNRGVLYLHMYDGAHFNVHPVYNGVHLQIKLILGDLDSTVFQGIGPESQPRRNFDVLGNNSFAACIAAGFPGLAQYLLQGGLLYLGNHFMTMSIRHNKLF